MKINNYIDHTNLKPDATKEDIKQLCDEAIKHGFYSVCVNPYYVKYAAELLGDYEVKIASVVGFPLGSSITAVKAAEAKMAVNDGADEIDMVINISALKNKDYAYVENDIKEVVRLSQPYIVKVILETCLLTGEEIDKACSIVVNSGAHFVKTSTGFSSGGAEIEIVRRMRANVGPEFGVKASGGIRNYEDCIGFINAGANRIGASASVQIVTPRE